MQLQPSGGRQGERLLVALVVASFASLIAIDASRRGLLPLDHSIVFDGGYRILKGQRPLIDYAAPSGLVPSLVQAGAFALFGISWFSYSLHAGALNAAAALTTLAFLRPRFGTLVMPIALSVATAVVFIPPIGVPYPDQYSLLLSAVSALLLDRAASARNSRSATIHALLSGCAFGLAFLSKAIPAILLLPAFSAVHVYRRRWTGVAGLSALASGAVCSSFLVLTGLGIPLGTSYDAYASGLMQIAIGRLRLAAGEIEGSAPWLRAISAWWPFLVIWGIAASLVLVLARHDQRSQATCDREAASDLLLSLALLAPSLLFSVLTFRSAETSLGLAFLSAGIILSVLERSPTPPPGEDRRATAFLTGKAAAALLLLTSSLVTLDIHRKVNLTRRANLLNLTDEAHVDCGVRGLEFLQLEIPWFTGCEPRDYCAITDFLAANTGEFLLVGDSSILYAITGRPSLSPVLWYHPALTLPWSDGHATPEFERLVVQVLTERSVRFVVLEGSGTQMGVSPGTLPRTTHWVLQHELRRFRLGCFVLIELREPARLATPVPSE